tara:strand:- start:6854 stop:7852 length:999 start_codon:yes stop_codon:yes gene_type:complete
MGFLRKIGRKFKKGMKKLFSSKIGAFIGGVAISMMLGPLVSRAWNGLKSVAGFGQKAVTQATVNTASTQAATTAAQTGSATTSQIASGTDALSKKLTSITGGTSPQSAVLKTSSSTLESKIAGAFNKGSGLGNNALDFTTNLSEGVVSGNIPLKINTSVTGSINDVLDYSNTGDMFTEKLSSYKKFTNPTKTTATSKTPMFGDGNLLKDIKQNFKDIPSKVTNFKDGEFIPDAISGAVQSGIKNLMVGKEEDMGGYGRVASMPVGTSPQSAVLSDLTSQYSYQTGTSVPTFNFQNLSQQTLYGTGSSQFIGNIYQPIDLADILPVTDTRTLR